MRRWAARTRAAAAPSASADRGRTAMAELTQPAALLLATALAACASPRGFDRGRLLESIAPDQVVTDAEIGRVLELRPQLVEPFALGVYLTEPAWSEWHARWSWLPADKERLLALGASLERQGLVSRTVYVSSSIVADESPESIRLAAAQHGLDAVLVVSGASDVDRYNNALGPLYALLVTGLFVPGTVLDGLFVSHAALWDVRNGFLYASVEADGESSQTRPAAWSSAEDAVEAAKRASLEQLVADLAVRIRGLDR